MSEAATTSQPAQGSPEHFDVLIAGAGISGVGAAYHLTKQCPGKTFVALDMQESFGGTWWTRRYPGIRSDSDLHTFGYRFKPWTGPPIATAEEILDYMGEVIDENGLARHIRYRHKILSASWSSRDKLWKIEAERTDTGERLAFTAGFLWMCQGYYRHSQGYMPSWPGMDTFSGRLVHSETWPEDLDYNDKKVVVIGSGATAATIIPAIAADCSHVTMLQRSPTFYITGRNVNDLAETLRQLQVDDAWIHEIVRRKILYDQAAFTRRCVEEPDVVAKELIGVVRNHLGPDYDVAQHFTPTYRPWRQRIAFIPDADLFKAIAGGKASVITDEIECVNPAGILLKSGKQLDADIIIAATGFNISVLGDIAFTVDGKPLVFSDTVTYRGMMFTGLPNLAWVFGYFRASWTLRADMVADFVCRLLKHMDGIGARKVAVALRPEDRDMPLLPWIDPQNFNPGYMMRAMHLLPKRGDKPEWQHNQDYWSEKDEIPAVNLSDAAFVYE
ncbi:MAG TPA: NAD(P)/FAD-dependent oxidoreductase [Hyphomicrobiaceae bacterium]|nr:NAD(P)/FAD-dependent oxidoreductase [Hyphomicrobiaceae bacterium]